MTIQRTLRFGAGLTAFLLSTACGGGGDDTPSQGDGMGGANSDVAAFPVSDCKTDIDCDDGLYCTGVETCKTFDDGYKLCQSGTPIACDDGIECTIDSCNEEEQACQSTPPDVDGDGHADASCVSAEGSPLGDDCDDGDANRFPGNEEVCDTVGHDEDCDLGTYGKRDVDADGYDDAQCCNGSGDTLICGDDCDDHEPSTRPGQIEICDQLDNNCDGEVDEGTMISGYLDADGDQHGDPNQPIMACEVSSRFSLHGDDCDDNNTARFGTHPEICDLIDNDCDGVVDDFTLAVTWYPDADGDGFGDAGGETIVACDPPAGHSILPLDCDDTSAGINPGQEERCDGLDNDCNGEADFVLGVNDSEDDDRDGSVDARCGGVGGDCDDNNAAVYPGAYSQCDGLDNDCDGEIDDDDGEKTWYADVDGDGFGDEGTTIEACMAPPGFVARAGDCDDSSADKYPGAYDGCGGGDEDCDGDVDENAIRFAFYADADGDGAGGGDPLLACTQPPGYGLLPNDCDDGNVLRFEGNPEVCDGVDNDCDLEADNDPTLCDDVGTEGSCVAGSCVINNCIGSYDDCDEDAQTGCEVDTNSDPLHCGACDDPCPVGANATATCVDQVCGIVCDDGYVDCDKSFATGCEAHFLSDPDNCGGCDMRCDDADNAPATCVDGKCEYTCEEGYDDCDGETDNGCESRLADDSENCGACGTVCPGEDECVRGVCQSSPWVSDGSDGAFLPTETVTYLDDRVYNFTTITIPQGYVVYGGMGGHLELYATGEILIDGVINLSGTAGYQGNGGNHNCQCAANNFGVVSASGGATGYPYGFRGWGDAGGCPPVADGGLGGMGTKGSGGCCGQGGNKGGGSGSACNGGGGGGGGFAGGAGAGYTQFGGKGGSVIDIGTGGEGRYGQPGLGGETGLAIYGGYDGTNWCGGGGSIGLAAANDLAVLTTFQTGSGGGGGASDKNAGGGGGGGGGALRLSTPARLVVGLTGSIHASGGAGGSLGNVSHWAGGGGSGGVIYISARQLEVLGGVYARGGYTYCGGAGTAGNGGLGRIRLSTLPDRCTITGTFDPPLADGCNVTNPAVPGSTYIDTYPF